MNFEKPYNLEDAQEEAEKLTDKVESGKAFDYEEANGQVDREKEKEENEKAKIFEQGDVQRFETVADDINRLVGALRERNHDGLNQLIDDGHLPRLRASAEKMLINEKTTIEDLANAIRTVTIALDEFGHAPREARLVDDTDNLRKIMFLIGRIDDDMLTARGAIGAREKDDYIPIVLGLQRASDMLVNARTYIGRRLNLLDRR